MWRLRSQSPKVTERDRVSATARSPECPRHREHHNGRDGDLRQRRNEVRQSRFRDGVEAMRNRRTVEQRGEYPDGDGFPSAENRDALTAQGDERRNEPAGDEPAEYQRRIGQLPVPRLSPEQPRVEEDEQSAGGKENAANHR